MEITLLSPSSIRIRTKNATFVVNPEKSIAKTTADAIISMQKTADLDTSRVDEFRLLIAGPGEYEVGGAKISGVSDTEYPSYVLHADNLEVFLVHGQTLGKAKEGSEYAVVVVDSEQVVDASAITQLAPRVVVLFGEKAEETAKALATESVNKSKKLQVTSDKLPEKMEVTVLE